MTIDSVARVSRCLFGIRVPRRISAFGSKRSAFSTFSPRCGILGLDRVHRNPDKRPPSLAGLIQQKKDEQSRPSNMRVYPSPPSASKACKEPVEAVQAAQLKILDPTGIRTKLFNRYNLDGVKVGDILLVRNKDGDPFAGVLLNIRRRGIDTSILLRNHLTRVGVEMWYKIYSPNIEGIEVVQRRIKRARRERLYYMRQPKHDIGSVENVVQQYLRQRQMLRTGEGNKGRDANANKKKGRMGARGQK